jgi:hypothetical protein
VQSKPSEARLRDGPASGWRQKGAGQVVKLSPRKTVSARRLHELGKVDFTGNKPGGPLLVGLGWLEPFNLHTLHTLSNAAVPPAIN